MSKNILITKGPSREVMFDALRLTQEDRLLHFEIDNNKTAGGGLRFIENKGGDIQSILVRVHGIESAGNNGDCWKLLISIVTEANFPGIKSDVPVYQTLCTVKASYSTETLKGSINLSPKKSENE